MVSKSPKVILCYIEVFFTNKKQEKFSQRRNSRRGEILAEEKFSQRRNSRRREILAEKKFRRGKKTIFSCAEQYERSRAYVGRGPVTLYYGEILGNTQSESASGCYYGDRAFDLRLLRNSV